MLLCFDAVRASAFQTFQSSLISMAVSSILPPAKPAGVMIRHVQANQKSGGSIPFLHFKDCSHTLEQLEISFLGVD